MELMELAVSGIEEISYKVNALLFLDSCYCVKSEN